MAKLAWNILADKDSLWTQVLKAKYKFNPGLRAPPLPKPLDSPTWKGICKAWPIMEQGVKLDPEYGPDHLFYA